MSQPRGPFSNRGPKEITSISTALTYSPPITWIQVVSAGSGGLVVKSEDDVSQTLTGLGAGDVYVGPFNEITSMTCAKIRIGDGPPPVSSQGVSLAPLYTNALTTQAMIHVPLSSGILAAGTPLAAWANNASSNPGLTIANSKAYAIRWNDNASQTAVWFGVPMPQDLDDTAAIVIHALVSKTGATLADATTLTITAFFQTAGALHDADADCGGTSSAVVGDATAKTVTELTLTIAASDVPPSPSNLSFTVKPSDSTLGTDDFVLHALWIEYTRKLLTS